MIKNGKNLDIFINDEDFDVRAEVARQGYGLDKLVNDKDFDVFHACEEFLNNK